MAREASRGVCEVCGEALDPQRSFCLRCGIGAGPKVIRGLRGWLLLVGLHVCINPLVLSFSFFAVAGFLLSDGKSLAAPTSDQYVPWLGPLAFLEVVVTLVFLVGWAIAAVLYFMKKPRFPRTYIVLTLALLAWVVVETVLWSMAFGASEVLDAAKIREIAAAVLFATIWVPYMLTSERVSNTFVERG